MSKKNIFTAFFLILITLVFLGVAPLRAQETENPPMLTSAADETLPQHQPEAVAGEDQNVPVGSKVIFDGSKSINPKEGKLKYTWDFGDGTEVEGVNELHVYDDPGIYVVKLTVDNGERSDSDELIVSVYENLVLLMADSSTKEESLQELERNAAREGVLIIRVQDTSGQPDYIAVETLAKDLAEERTNLQKSNLLIDWTNGSVGLNALTKFIQPAENIKELDLTHKAIVSVTTKAGVTSRVAQQTYDLAKPDFIVLTDETALKNLVSAKTPTELLENLRRSPVEYKIIGIHSERSIKELGWLNFMSYTINYMVNNGVPINTIFLILMIPIIATIIAFSRQVIGIKAFGLYIPTILTLAFLVTGIKYGLVIFITMLVVATLVRIGLKYLRILYLPRMAMVLTATALAMFIMFAFSAHTNRTGFIAISIFPILIIAILAEEFVKVQIEKGFVTATQLAVETLIIATLCYFLVSWEAVRTFFLSYPETILFTIPLNYLLGKWTGLRLTEYFRFYQLLKHDKAS